MIGQPSDMERGPEEDSALVRSTIAELMALRAEMEQRWAAEERAKAQREEY